MVKQCRDKLKKMKGECHNKRQNNLEYRSRENELEVFRGI